MTPLVDIALIHPFFQAVRSPLVLLNETGELLLANTAGEKQFQKRFLFLHDLQTHFTPFQDLLHAWRNWLESPCPIYLAGVDDRLALTPVYLSQGADRTPERYILLEWQFGRHDQELEILQAVGEAVNSSLILEDIFEALGDVLHQYIPYQLATIVILDDSQNGIKTQVRLHEDSGLEIIGEYNTFAGYEPIVDLMVKKPFPLLYAHPDLIPPALRQSLFLTPDTASAILVPLINKGIVIGLIAMVSNHTGIFKENHQHLLLQVSEQLAIAVENAKFYWQTQIQAGREFLINQLTKAILKSMDIEVILRTAAEELGKVTGVSRCFIHYFPKNLLLSMLEDPREMRVFQYAVPEFQFHQEEYAAAENVNPWVLERSVFENRPQAVSLDHPEERREQVYNPFILNDVADCPEFLASRDYFERRKIKSLAVFPILIRDVLVGTITLHQCASYRVWISEDIALFKAIAEHLGLALHQARLFLELEIQKSELEHALNELQQAQCQLIQSEKMAVLGQFVAGIAHEVNTPLGTIASNNDILRRCLEKFKEAQCKESQYQGAKQGESADDKLAGILPTMTDLLQLNRLATDRIQEIVKNLRNFARLDESEMKRADIHEGLESTLLLVKHSVAPSIEIVRDYWLDLPMVTCFPGLLNQVFMNLLVNAIHALEGFPRGTITLKTSMVQAEERQPHPDVASQYVRITVSDTGKGITPEHMPKIFDPGFTTKGVGVGTGMGLALCFKIIQKHKGRIMVESALGQGSSFHVLIPLIDTP